LIKLEGLALIISWLPGIEVVLIYQMLESLLAILEELIAPMALPCFLLLQII